MRIAFHTPLNAWDDGRISGDRRMAGQLAQGLEALGHVVEPVRDARAHLPTPAALGALKRQASVRLESLLAGWRESGAAPQLWFTYHSYYKAPDLLGPAVAARLGIPYVVAEASDSRRRASGEWAEAVALARASFAAADLHLCFTAQDRVGIAPWARPGAPLLDLPPFIMALPPQRAQPRGEGPLRLVTVAMMRAGVKYESYRALAAALARVRDRDWALTIIGDGPLRAEVEQVFAGLPASRIVWRGALAHGDVAAELSAHDLFIWPGLGEAYGLVYLEAQAAGLPVIAFASGGVPETVRPGETALLAPEGDEVALAEAVARLIDDSGLRERMGRDAARFIRAERSGEAACRILATGLDLATRHFQRDGAFLP